MRWVQSHGRLLVIMAVVSIPVLIGFGSGFWLSQEAMDIRQKQVESSRLQNVSAQAQMLVGMLKSEVEILRLQAKSMATGTPHEIPGNLLHWAELEIDGNSLTRVKRVLKNPRWSGDAAMESSYLSSALKNLNLQEILKQGVSILRMKKDLNSGGEWLCFAFPSSESPQSVWLTLVDPSTAFQSYRNWARHSEGGKSRSYLIGSDGRVLTHSQKNWIFSDMSGSNFYRDVIRKLLNGSLGSGFGEYTSMDRLPVASAFYRLGPLPLAVVVEEVNTSHLEKINELKILSLGGAAILVLGVIIFGCALILGSYLVKVVTLTVQNESDDALDPKKRAGFGLSEAELPEGQFFKGDELLIVDAIRSSNTSSE